MRWLDCLEVKASLLESIRGYTLAALQGLSRIRVANIIYTKREMQRHIAGLPVLRILIPPNPSMHIQLFLGRSSDTLFEKIPNTQPTGPKGGKIRKGWSAVSSWQTSSHSYRIQCSLSDPQKCQEQFAQMYSKHTHLSHVGDL